MAPRVKAFAAQMLGGLSRRDQRAKGELYLRGLLLDGKRKSMQPMAQRLEVDHQQLQQFVSSSTWDYTDVRERLAGWAEEFVRRGRSCLMTPDFPRMARIRPVLRGCTAGRWARPVTARSG